MTTIFKENIDGPIEMRAFMEEKLEKDYFFKSKTIEKASLHPNVKTIKHILDRDEETMWPLEEGEKRDKNIFDKSAKFLDLFKTRVYKT